MSKGNKQGRMLVRPARRRLQLQPPVIDPALPDVSEVRELVQKAIADSEKQANTDEPKTTTVGKLKKARKSKKSHQAVGPAPSGGTVDLNKVCSYS